VSRKISIKQSEVARLHILSLLIPPKDGRNKIQECIAGSLEQKLVKEMFMKGMDHNKVYIKKIDRLYN